MDQRSMAIVNQLIQEDSYLSIQQLATLFNVSRRTIYNDIDKINDWLRDNGLVEIQQVRSEGLYLEKETKKGILAIENFLESFYYEFSPVERKAWIYIHVFASEKPYYLDDIRELFQVSRNTVLEDIKRLKEEIQQYDLSLYSERGYGYRLKGIESDIRRMFIHYLSMVVPKDGWHGLLTNISMDTPSSIETVFKPYLIFNTSLLLELQTFLYSYERQVKVEMTDEILNKLVILFYFFVQRIMQQEAVQVDPVEKEIIQITEEYCGAKTICKSISNVIHTPFSHDEVCYFAKYLLSAKVNYDQSLQKESQEMKELKEVIGKMVIEFEALAAINFDNLEHLMQNLLLHLKPAYFRIKYGIKVENELRDMVKQNHPEVFHITKQVIHHFENLLEQSIDDNEIAYIAMHFGGWLRKEGMVIEQRKKRLLIVCTNGLGTSRLLESQLQGLFTDVEIHGVTSLREYERMELFIDFIISTIPLNDRGVPIFVVNPVLSNEDKEQLFRKVNSLFSDSMQPQTYSVDALIDLISRYGTIDDEGALRQELRRYLHSPHNVESKVMKQSLFELLPGERVAIKKSIDNWEKAIEVAAKPLLEQGYIESSYVDRMIHAVHEKGPYIVIADRFALPHGSPDDGVHKTGLSMLKLEEPVDMLGKEVNIIVVLASIDNERHLKAISQLTKLFTDKTNQDTVMQTKEKRKIMKLIEDYSRE
ncbi:BglG family transcription antiterminator [Paucisalibacillus globulus]|uniref:BglG family transcription antiterminator n=1 Tax=Paucisalibacillus globulus TaxID=351095 RepID=UPI0004132D60|nr:BglG family transcription antiterminator [Paucisalibacillus globulus]